MRITIKLSGKLTVHSSELGTLFKFPTVYLLVAQQAMNGTSEKRFREKQNTND